MARRSSHPFDALAGRFAQVIADRLLPLLKEAIPRRGPGRPPGPGKKPGRPRDMSCRYPGCPNRSKGPRFRFFCEKHLKLPKKQQDAALQKWAQKHG